MDMRVEQHSREEILQVAVGCFHKLHIADGLVEALSADVHGLDMLGQHGLHITNPVVCHLQRGEAGQHVCGNGLGLRHLPDITCQCIIGKIEIGHHIVHLSIGEEIINHTRQVVVVQVDVPQLGELQQFLRQRSREVVACEHELLHVTVRHLHTFQYGRLALV